MIRNRAAGSGQEKRKEDIDSKELKVSGSKPGVEKEEVNKD